MLDSVSLTYGEGVPGDRVAAISRGQVAKNTAPFYQLTTHESLVHFCSGQTDDALTLHERGSDASPDLLSDQTRLREVFGEHAGAIQREDGLGHWDFDDSMLSIINVNTVKALAAKMGVPVDPMRFRGNIYIEAEPFSEFDWLGRGVQFGDTCLSIIRPIKRCRATSVNPKTGEVDMNTPAQLNRHFGHLYCGVYAQVERGGTLALGDCVLATSEYFPAKLAIAATVPKAPALVSWPRPVKVVDIIEEATDIRSLWLEDPLAVLGSLNDIKAGQHIALHGLTDTGVWRRYTVSGREGDRLRITVKRDAGEGSQAVHAFEVGDLIRLSGPFGPDTLDLDSPAILILSAGIGITPTAIKLKALADARYAKPVRVVHSVRFSHELALWAEVGTNAQSLSNASTALHITQDTAGVQNAVAGRPDITALVAEATRVSASIHVCGSERFQEQVLAAATLAGISESVHMDSFATPDTPVEMRAIPESGPFVVTFKRSGIVAKWQPQDGPLLNFAESKGLVVPAHCRAGLCQTCECAVIEGEVLALTEPSRTKSGHALLCAAVPVGDLVLDC
jgi:ferredoxin-NADP reductase